MSDQIKYSMQLAMLNRLRESQMVTNREYALIKKDLMRKYKIRFAEHS